MKRTIETAAIAFALLAGGVAQLRADPPSLRQAAAGLFAIGAGLSDQIPLRTNDWALLTNQFTIVTPENCMKPAAVQAAEGQFNFTQADAFVDFAERHQLKIVGHCLVWAKDDRTPPWSYRDVGRCERSARRRDELPAAIRLGKGLRRGFHCRRVRGRAPGRPEGAA